jgi:hypothetical protein
METSRWPPSSLWQTFLRAAAGSGVYGTEAYIQKSSQAWERSAAAAERGATLFTNGTVCVHSLPQLETLCNVDIEASHCPSFVGGSTNHSFFSSSGIDALLGVYRTYKHRWAGVHSLDEDISWTGIFHSLAHIMMSLVLLYIARKYVSVFLRYVYSRVSAHIMASSSRDAAIIRKWIVQPIMDHRDTFHWMYLMLRKPFASIYDFRTEKKEEQRADSVRSNEAHYPRNDEAEDEDDVPPPAPVQNQGKKQGALHSFDGIPDEVYLVNGDTLQHDQPNTKDRETDGIFHDGVIGNDHGENDFDDMSSVDSRPLFLTTIDSVHPNIAGSTAELYELLDKLTGVAPPPNQRTYTQEGKTAPLQGANCQMHAGDDETMDEDIETFRTSNVLSAGENFFELPPPSRVPNLVETIETVADRNMPILYSAFARPAFITERCIGADYDDFWVEPLPSYTHLRHLLESHLDRQEKGPHPYPLHKRCRMAYVPRNPVVEKRWYQASCSSFYPRLSYEKMIQFFTRCSSIGYKEFFTGGHIALLVMNRTQAEQEGVFRSSSPKENYTSYETFMLNHWFVQGPGKDSMRLYIPFVPSVSAESDTSLLATEIASYLDEIVRTIIEWSYRRPTE